MHGRGLALGLHLLLVLWMALLTALSATAQDDEEEEEEDESSRPGFYLLARFTNNVLLDGGDYSTGAEGSVGYRIRPWLAAELTGDWVSGFDLSGGGTRLVAGTYGPTARFYPMRGRFQPYGLVGVGATFFDGRNTALAPYDQTQWDMSFRLGVGIDWYVSYEFGLNFGPTFVIPVGINDDLGVDHSYVSIGVGGFLRIGD